jgi:hypothetical protein
MSGPGFWRDRVNGKWYYNDVAGRLFEIRETPNPAMLPPFEIILLERDNPRAYEDYDERRTRPRKVDDASSRES